MQQVWATGVANVLEPIGHSVVSVHAEPGDCAQNAAYHINAYLHVRCTVEFGLLPSSVA